MSSSILHHCPFCGQFTDISIQLAAFIENPSCGQCGLSASESNLNMQDELSILFAKQMTMDSLDPSTPTRGHLLPFASPPEAAKITYSVSQHYHHSSHVASRQQAEPSKEESVFSLMSADPSVADILRSYNIDPLSLSSDQLGLFDRADQEQRARLVQMWQICGNGSAQAGSAERDFEMDDSMQMAGSTDEGHYAEPYMVSGYQSLRERDAVSANTAMPNELSTGAPYRQATDPVCHGQRWWETGKTSHMENQYGNFEQRAQFIGCGVRNAHWL